MKFQEITEAMDLDKQQIIAWLNKHKVERFQINNDLSVDVDGDVKASYENLRVIPVNFNEVSGKFDCSENKLTSLQGSPQIVGTGFYCDDNKLTSLEGGPQKIGRDFYCDNNNLRSLQGAPQEIGTSFDCSSNKLTSLEGAPQKVGGSFFCENNKLTSLEGAPQILNGTFFSYDNPLTSLHNIHRQVREITGKIVLPITIKSHILGLMRIRKLNYVDTTNASNAQLSQALEIINKNLRDKGNIHTTQEQLLDAGLAEFAQL